jgi:hypothetical protein
MSWWLAWMASQFIISIAVFTAFLIAFNTPTIGLGCRSFFYIIQWTLTSVTWVIQGIYHDPPEWVRCISLVFNTLSAMLLMLLMIFQVRQSEKLWFRAQLTSFFRLAEFSIPAFVSRHSSEADTLDLLVIGVDMSSLAIANFMKRHTTFRFIGTLRVQSDCSAASFARCG